MKTRVIMIQQNEYKEWELFEEGFIDGYIQGGDNRPYACIVIGERVVMAPFHCFKVVVSYTTTY